MISGDLKPSLIEINQMPSFSTDSPLDYRVKRGLIIDVMKKLCLNMRKKQQYKAERKARLQRQILTGPRRATVANNEVDGQNDDKTKKEFKEDALKHEDIRKIEKEKG